MERDQERNRVSWERRKREVRVLLTDRKNAIGGPGVGFVDFGELGPHQGEHMPLSGEHIKRAFGEPPKGDPEGAYRLSLKAQSHRLLEDALEELENDSEVIHLALTSMYPLDDAGDRDYDFYKAKLKSPHGPTREAAESFLILVEMGVNWLTRRLWDEDLWVEMPKRRTIREEDSMERGNRNIYMRFEDLKKANPKRKVSEVYDDMRIETGLSVERLRAIVRRQREAAGFPRRKRGGQKREDT